MPDTTNRSQPTILHIRPDDDQGAGRSNAVSPITVALAASPLTVEKVGDVYRGLAWLCARRTTDETEPEGRPGSRNWRHHDLAVVVCVDDLGHAEFEFFSLAAQARSDCPVYVYSDGRSDFAVKRALAAGATGVATEAIIRSLHEKSQSANVQGRGRQQGNTQPAIERREGPPDDSVVEYMEPDVRFPWLHYTDAPRRRPPPRRTEETSKQQNVKTSQHPPAEPPAGKPVQGDSGIDETTGNGGMAKRGEGRWLGAPAPLLTPEELQALLSDDIAALAPHESGPPTSATSAPPGGPSGNVPPSEGDTAGRSGTSGENAGRDS